MVYSQLAWICLLQMGLLKSALDDKGLRSVNLTPTCLGWTQRHCTEDGREFRCNQLPSKTCYVRVTIKSLCGYSDYVVGVDVVYTAGTQPSLIVCTYREDQAHFKEWKEEHTITIVRIDKSSSRCKESNDSNARKHDDIAAR